jgi:hypothetical protein
MTTQLIMAMIAEFNDAASACARACQGVDSVELGRPPTSEELDRLAVALDRYNDSISAICRHVPVTSADANTKADFLLGFIKTADLSEDQLEELILSQCPGHFPCERIMSASDTYKPSRPSTEALSFGQRVMALSPARRSLVVNALAAMLAANEREQAAKCGPAPEDDRPDCYLISDRQSPIDA